MPDFPVYSCPECNDTLSYTGQFLHPATNLLHTAPYEITLTYACTSGHVYSVPSSPDTDPFYEEHQQCVLAAPPPFPGHRHS